MKLQDFLAVVYYDDFEICKDTDTNGLKRIFKITKDTPIQYLCVELLNAEVLNVFINDGIREEDESLFTIVVRI